MNKLGPDVESYAILDESIWKTLSVSFSFTACFLRFEYECTKVTESSGKQYAWSFAASKSWRIQSKALQRSKRTVPI